MALAQTELKNSDWPDLDDPALGATLEALHLWSQVVGKIRLAVTPWENHGWHVPLYVDARGLSTGLMPDPRGSFSIAFDFLDDKLVIATTSGHVRGIELIGRSVASFHADVLVAMTDIGLPVTITSMPNEIPEAVPFEQDLAIRRYDPTAARKYWQALVQIHRVFQRFRTRFVGKCSPIHLFWGSFDLALTRFSGRKAPLHPGGGVHLPDAVAREAYNHEVSSAGFWPGGGTINEPTFYSYAYPTPDGFGSASIRPSAGRFDTDLGEFLLSYRAVRDSADPDGDLLAFLQTTYEAAADLGGWDRSALEGPEGTVGTPPA